VKQLASGPKVSRRESLESLRQLLSQHGEVVLAYLFGSVAEGGLSAHDVDLALKLESEDSSDAIATLTGEIAKILKISEDRVDIVDIDKAGLPLKYKVLTQGVKLVNKRDAEGALISDVVENYPIYNMDYEYLCNLWLKEDPRIDKKLLLKRLDELLRNVTMMKEKYVDKDVSWLLKDLERAYAFERSIHRALEAMLDICRHIVSAKRLGLAEYYSDYPLRIAEANLMDSQMAASISKLAKLRNILIHEYTELNYEKLLDEARKLVNELSPKFTEWLRKFLTRE
jgi:uncharacterized protein YutE (UPF0331/DUF86 family)/predicted nucleotidyltransferase